MDLRKSPFNYGIDAANEHDRRIWSGVMVGSAIPLATTIMSLTATSSPEVPTPPTTTIEKDI